MKKIEKIFEVLGWITIILYLIMITLFIITCIKLARYNECRDLEFEPPYCEKYKNY